MWSSAPTETRRAVATVRDEIWNVRQDLLDREQAPVMARCWCCGTEIYSMRDVELYDGLCEECWMETEEEEDEDG